MTIYSLAEILNKSPLIEKSFVQHTCGNWKRRGPSTGGGGHIEIDDPIHEFRIVLLTKSKCADEKDHTLRGAVTKAFKNLGIEMPAELAP